MNTFAELLAPWLADYFLLSTLLLSVVLVLFRLLNQPTRRLVLARPTLAALLLLSALCALPGWSLVHLMTAEQPARDLLALSNAQTILPIEQQATQLIPTTNIDLVPQPTPSLPSPTIDTTPIAAPTAKQVPWALWLVVTYLVGSLLVVFWQATGNALARRLVRQAALAPPQLQKLLSELNGTTRLLLSDQVQAPAALGVLQPTILLPKQLSTEQNNSLRPILAHELAHIRHGDLRTLAAVRLLTIPLWPQPLYWLLRRQIRLDQETLADAAAAEVTSRTDYAEQLVAWAREATYGSRRLPLASSVGLWESPSQLKQRVAMLLDQKLTILRTCSHRWRIGSAISLLTLSVCLSLVTLTPPAQLQAENPSQVAQEAEETPANTVEATPDGGWQIVASSPPADADSGNSSETGTVTTAHSTALSDEEKGKLMRPLYKQLREATKPNMIHGICLDEHAQPLAGVSIKVFSKRIAGTNVNTKPILTTQSDEQGRFRFTKVVNIEKEFPNGIPDENFQGRNASILATIGKTARRVPGYSSNFASTIAQRGQEVVWMMQPAETLSGRVTNEQGQPIEGAVVRAGIYSTLAGATNINSATTNANGEYSINDLAAYNAAEERQKFNEAKKADPNLEHTWGMHAFPTKTVFVLHPNFAAKRITIENIPNALNVKLQPGSVIEGAVTLPEGETTTKPLAGSIVRLQRVIPQPKPGEQLDLHSFQVDNTTLDEAGHYRFESLPAGKYHLTADVEGWVTQGIENVEVAGGETTTAPDIPLMHGGRIRVQLIDHKTDEPMHFETPTKGYINPQQRPQRAAIFFSRDNIAEFSTEGIAEKQIPAGIYSILVSIPDKEKGNLTSIISNTLEEWPTYEVKDRKLLEITVRMKRQKPPTLATGTFTASSPPSDTEESTDDESSKARLILAIPPAEEK